MARSKRLADKERFWRSMVKQQRQGGATIRAFCREQGISVLLSSHLLNQVQRICTRVGIMIKGKLVATGTVEELATVMGGDAKAGLSLEDIYMRYFQEQ